MIKLTNEQILEIGAQYGLTNDIIGYTDFEKLLIKFSAELYVKGYNAGYKAAKDHMLLATCDCWEV